ncbi:hypothetical protein DN752_09785 [Echinicola strongylocentroti]|uniref:Transporter n=1 Tax=Echinicola strongylocentroti TaxID=1795355 RepID=A0A2Z4II52_9BACT|nr:hypothetical protein [Echinicola strongylocentroti]AWW30387.1 hypothetical protein DN752_09785 [Echinicola strongylocentroti]
MKEKLNTSLQSISLIAVAGLAAWSVFYDELSALKLLSYLIIFLVFIEVLSLILIRKTYPESHTTFKVGIIATLLILLGIKRMLPDFFVPLAVITFAINYFYNFYTNNKRRKGQFKRKKPSKFKL